MIISHKFKIYNIIKCHAGTSTDELIREQPNIDNTSPSEEVILKRRIIEDDNRDEIKVDEAAPHYLPPKTKCELSHEDKEFLTNNESLKRTTVWQQFENNVGNQFADEQVRTTNPFYIPPVLSKETIMLDQGVKLVTAQIDEIGTRIGKEITKSTELASIWKVHLHAYDEYIKSLSTIPWKKVLIASATLITISAIAWKMISMRAIPNFLGNMISLVPLPVGSLNIPKDVVSVPKPNIETTMRAIMETPLTPLTIAASVGVLSITLGLLKVTLWVLRRAPK
jgi:hypothetical protein